MGMVQSWDTLVMTVMAPTATSPPYRARLELKLMESRLSVVSHELMPEMDMLTRVQAEAPEHVAEDEKTNA